MTTTTVVRRIDAPVARVFRTVADISNFSQAIAHIVAVEFTSEIRVGVGTRFRETRLQHGKEVVTELEVTEYAVDDRIRLVAESHGTVWDTLFTVRPDAGQTELTMVMEARSDRLVARILNRLIRTMIQKAVEKDLDAVKAYCEG